MRPAMTVALLSSALVLTAFGEVDARPRTRTYYGPGAGVYYHPPSFQGRSAWVAGRSRGGAACTIYSCPTTFNPGTPLNPEGNIRPEGIP